MTDASGKASLANGREGLGQQSLFPLLPHQLPLPVSPVVKDSGTWHYYAAVISIAILFAGSDSFLQSDPNMNLCVFYC